MKTPAHFSLTTFSIKTGAKLVRFPGGEKKFAAWMRNQSFLLDKNEPYQKYVDQGWFIMELATIHKANPPFKVPVSRITLKGLTELEKVVFDQFHKPPCA